MTLQPLSWDSDFCGYKVGRIDCEPDQPADTLDNMLHEARQQGFRLIYAAIPYPAEIDSAILRRHNGLKADSKVTFICRPVTPETASIPTGIEEFHGSPEQLYDLAYESGLYSRFALDPRFGTENFRRMYRLWVDNSIAGLIADRIYVARTDSGPVSGFVTLKAGGGQASIGLIAVSPDSRGRSIGSALIAACKRQAIEAGCTSLSVVTQSDNVPACNFYSKNGFTIDNIVNIYHFWPQ